MATKQAYFAVAVCDDGTMYVDNEISVNFDSPAIWNEVTEFWEDISEHEEFYEMAGLQLDQALESHNKTLDN